MSAPDPRPAQRGSARGVGGDLTFLRYAEGAAGFAAAAVLIGYAAVRLRGRLLPSWVAAPARLVEFVLGLSILTMLLQLLGAIGMLTFAGIVIGAAAVAGAAHLLIKPRVGEEPLATEPELGPTWLQLGAAAIAVLVAAHWATGVQVAWSEGMSGFDTLWYHGPFAARFAQEGSTNALHFTDPEYLHWFYPLNSELLHSGGIVLFDRDVFSPLLNLGWLALALLSAWCIGRPYGVASLSLVAVAVVLDTATMVPREAGSAANDIGAIALLLAAAAIMITAEAPGTKQKLTDPGVLIAAGLAAGLALGTKLTIAAAVLAMSAGVIFLATRGARMRTAGIWFASLAATGGFWFLRNMFHASGNPAPWVAHNLNFLPGPERGLEGRDPFSVGHYLFSFDTGVVRTFFLSGLHNVMGPLWPALLALAAGGMFMALARGRTPAIRMLGGVAIVAGVAYVFTPLGASGPEGAPDGFEINLRYFVPALALGLALLPLDRLFERRERQYVFGAVLVIVLGAVALFSKSKTAYQADDAFLPGALLIGLVLFAPLGLVLLWEERPRLAYVVAAGVAVIAFLGGWARQDDYLDSRYEGENRYEMQAAFRWANDVSDSRIGLAGTRAAFQQYGLYGRDVSNYVQFIGHPGAEGDFTRIGDCPAFLDAVNEGEYDFIVSTPDLDLNNGGRTNPAPESPWLAAELKAGALKQVAREGPVRVLEVTAPLDPATCPIQQ